jgi:hypothetical protein
LIENQKNIKSETKVTQKALLVSAKKIENDTSGEENYVCG